MTAAFNAAAPSTARSTGRGASASAQSQSPPSVRSAESECRHRQPACRRPRPGRYPPEPPPRPLRGADSGSGAAKASPPARQDRRRAGSAGRRPARARAGPRRAERARAGSTAARAGPAGWFRGWWAWWPMVPSDVRYRLCSPAVTGSAFPMSDTKCRSTFCVVCSRVCPDMAHCAKCPSMAIRASP